MSHFSNLFFTKCVIFTPGAPRFILENDIDIPRGGGAKKRKCWIWMFNGEMLHIGLVVNMCVVSLVELMHGGNGCNLSSSVEATHKPKCTNIDQCKIGPESRCETLEWYILRARKRAGACIRSVSTRKQISCCSATIWWWKYTGLLMLQSSTRQATTRCF